MKYSSETGTTDLMTLIPPSVSEGESADQRVEDHLLPSTHQRSWFQL